MVVFHRRLPRFNYLTPKSIDETLSLLSQHRGKAKLIAGGTDLVPKLRQREIQAPEYIIDLKGIPDLDKITFQEDIGLSLGALVTIRAVEKSPIIQERYNILYQSAETMASPQVRNRGTVAGNICNAVPSADMAPALLALQAKLRLISQRGERTVSIEDFFTGPNETTLADDEMLLEIQVPEMPTNSHGRYLKLTPRKSMDLALVGVAVILNTVNGTCQDIRIALGAVAPTPIRVNRAEEALRGQKLNEEAIESASLIAFEDCHPISDHRASAEYRREMVRTLTRRAITESIP